MFQFSSTKLRRRTGSTYFGTYSQRMDCLATEVDRAAGWSRNSESRARNGMKVSLRARNSAKPLIVSAINVAVLSGELIGVLDVRDVEAQRAYLTAAAKAIWAA